MRHTKRVLGRYRIHQQPVKKPRSSSAIEKGEGARVVLDVALYSIDAYSLLVTNTSKPESPIQHHIRLSITKNEASSPVDSQDAMMCRKRRLAG